MSKSLLSNANSFLNFKTKLNARILLNIWDGLNFSILREMKEKGRIAPVFFTSLWCEQFYLKSMHKRDWSNEKNGGNSNCNNSTDGVISFESPSGVNSHLIVVEQVFLWRFTLQFASSAQSSCNNQLWLQIELGFEAKHKICFNRNCFFHYSLMCDTLTVFEQKKFK